MQKTRIDIQYFKDTNFFLVFQGLTNYSSPIIGVFHYVLILNVYCWFTVSIKKRLYCVAKNDSMQIFCNYQINWSFLMYQDIFEPWHDSLRLKKHWRTSCWMDIKLCFQVFKILTLTQNMAIISLFLLIRF